MHSLYFMSATYVRPYKPSIVRCTANVHFDFFLLDVFVHEVVAWSMEGVKYRAALAV